jgi:sporulation domain protein
MKGKHSRLERKYKHYHIPAEGWQLSQDENKELERRQQVLQGLSELNRSDPGGARVIPSIVFHNISSSRRRQLAEEYPARNSQGASVGHLDYVGAIKEGLNDEEFATLESSFHAYINLPAELQQKWQGDLRASKPDSDEYKSRKEYERVYATWTAEGLCSLNKLAEEARAAGHQRSESKPKPAAKPEVIDEKNWDNIENRRAVVRRIAMLGNEGSAVVREAMLESVQREYYLAYLATLEPDGKARASLEKRRGELYDDLELARDKFSDSDTSAISKVISNFSYEQMDDLDKLVDEVAILAEKDPRGMKRLCSDVTQRSHKIRGEVNEIVLSDSLSSEEKCKQVADLAGNFNSSIIAQTREAAEAVTREPKPKRPSVKSQSEPTSQPSSEADPQSKQKSRQEQPESPTGGEKGRDTIEDRREMAERLRTLDGESKKLIGLSMHDFEREAESDKNGAQRMVMPSAESIVDKLSETVDDLKPEQVSELNHLIDEVATLKAEDPQKLTELAKKAQQEFDEVAHDVDNWSMYHERTHDIYTEDMEEHIKKHFRSDLKAELRGEFISASWRLPVHPPNGSSESPSEGGLAGKKEISPETNPEPKQLDVAPKSEPQPQLQQQELEQEQPEPAEPEPEPVPGPKPEPEPGFEPEPSAGGEGEEQSGATGEEQPEDDRQRLADRLVDLGKEGRYSSADLVRIAIMTRLSVSEEDQLYEGKSGFGYQKVSIVKDDTDSESGARYKVIPGDEKISDRAFSSEKGYSDELIDLGLKITDDLDKIPQKEGESIAKAMLQYCPYRKKGQSVEDYDRERERWSTWAINDISKRAKEIESGKREEEISPEGMASFREYVSGYIQEKILPKTPNSELLIHGFFYSLGAKRLEELMRKHSSVSGNSFDTMVRAIKDYDGLDSRECYKLKDFVDDLDTLRGGVDSQEGNELKQDDEVEQRRNAEAMKVIQSDVFAEGMRKIGELQGANASPDEIDRAMVDFGGEIQGLVHQRASRVELLNKYQRSSEDARRIANNLTFNELVGHYDEETHRWQPDIDNALTGKLNEERIDLLTDDEVKSYRKNLTLVNSLSKFSMGKLVEFDKKLADLKGGVVPPEVKETLQRYRPLLTAPNKDAAFYREPDTPEEVQAINQARTTIYQMELDKVNELAENDKKMGDRLKLCDTYRKSTAAVREAVNCLVNRDKFDRYDEDTGMERGEELENKVDKKPGETLYDALMRMENVSLLTDDEIESYRRHLEATKELSKDSLDRLIEISNNPESFDDSLVPPDIKEALKDYEDIEPETDEEIQAYNQAQAKLHQIMMNQIGELMKVDARVEKTRGLRGEYYRSDGDVQDVVDLLAERKIFDRYNESNGKYRGEELGENEQGETLSDALMRKDNICFLTDDEVDIYCKHLDLVRNLSTNHLKELMDLDDSLLDDPDNDVVPPDVKDVLAKYKDAAPDTPEEIQAYNQAQEKLYQILLERADSMRASEEADQARGVELKQKLFNKDVNPQIRRLVIGELMMKSMSKERYEEFAEAFGVGESGYGEPQFNIIKFMLRQSVSKANPDKTDDRGMSLEEYNYASEMLELALQLSDSQLKQLVESDEADKTRISNGRRDSEEFWESRQQYSKNLEQKIRQMVETEENDPMLSMVGVDRSRIVEMKAYIDAKRKLDEEMTFKPENFAAKDLNAEGKPKLLAKLRHAVVARFWKGKVMRNYYEYKYRKELKEQYSKDFTHTLGAETDGPSMSSAETEQALIWRMTQDSDFFTKTLGEKREQLSPDSEAYKRMYQAVKTFVENGDEAAFTEESRRINHDLMGNEGAPVLDNYLTSAIYIKGLVDHDRSFEDVMKGFKMYRGVSAEGVNSGHHEQAIDKLVAKFERRNADNKLSKLSWIPPEWVAGAAGIASWLGGAIARNRAVQAFSFGGSAALAGAMASAKESERVKIDRADLARRLAEGGKVDEDNDYETKLAETLPEMRTAESYMNAIDLAIAPGDIDQIRQALADVVVAREVGRNEGIDLIDYYSGGGDAEATKNELMSRQFDLEVAYINANSDPDLTLQKFKSRLIDGLNVASHAYSARFRTVEGDLFNQSNLSEDVQKQINEVYAAQEARDKIADRFRRKRMGAEFAKTAARTLAVSIGAQEIAAFFRSDLQGALEHAFGHDDAPGTTRTLLGGLLPTPNGNAVNEVVTGGARPEKQFYREDEINHEQIKQWQAEGYKVDKHFDYEPHGGQGTVSAEEAVRDNVTVHRSGWADNLTERIDGNELAGHHTDIATQYAFQPSHGATGMGFTISRSEIFDAGQDGQVELWLSPTRGTQANPFKIIGHVVDNQIVFDAEPGSEAAEMLANKSYAFAEVVHAKSGFVMSTEVGSGTATSFAHQAVEYVREQTGWDVIPPVDQIVSPAPVGTPDVEIPVPVPPIFRQAHDARQGLSTNEELRQVDATETESGTGHKLRDLLSREQMKARADRQWLKQRLDYLQQNDKYGAGLLESVMVNSLPGELIEQLPGASQKISFRPSKTEGNPAKVIPGEIVVPAEDAILSNEGYPPETIAMGLSIARSLRKLNKISDDDREGKLKQILRDQPKKGEWLPDVEDNSHESNEDFEKRRMKWAADTTDEIANLASPKSQRKHNFWKKYYELRHEMQIAMTGPWYDERVLGNRLSASVLSDVVNQALLAYYRDLGEDKEPDFNNFVDKFNRGDYTDGEPPRYFSKIAPFHNALIHKRWENGEEPSWLDLIFSTPPPPGQLL